MKIIIGFLIGFLILVYVYNYLKLRKRRKKQIDTVAEYHRRFASRRKSMHNLSDTNYEKYITKYNSKTDYISKEDIFL